MSTPSAPSVPIIQLSPAQIAALQQSQANLNALATYVKKFGNAGFDNSALAKNHQAALKGAAGLLREFGSVGTKGK